MNTLEVADRGIKLNVPGHWDEMTAGQLQYILQQAFMFTSGSISYHDFMIRSFFKLAGICRNWKTLVWERMVPAEVVSEKNANAFILAEQYCSFLLKKNEAGQLEINYDTIVNPFPRVTVKGEEWQGPADLLSDLSFGAFRAAMDEMNEYFRDRDPHALLRMIACLYRPAGTSFNRADLDGLSDQLRALPGWQRLAILLWFSWCIRYIQTEDLLIEGREISLKVLFPKADEGEGRSSGSAGLGWTGILFAIAKEGVFGTVDKTDKAGLFDVLLYLYDNYLQNKRKR